MKIFENYPLLQHNTFGIEAQCRWFVTYDSPEELRQFITNAPTELHYPESPVLHIGGGSNLLFLDNYEGIILHSNIKDITLLSSTEQQKYDKKEETIDLRVGAAVVWDDLVCYTLQHGYYGLENLSLIPGEVGASAVQNIGAYGAEAKDFITKVECMNLQTGELRIFVNEECHYGYRQSIFKTEEYRGRWAVLYVTYRLSRTFEPHLDYGGIRADLERRDIPIESLTAGQLRQVIIDIRQAKLPDPKVQGNAGSFFMNPVVTRKQYGELARLYPTMPHYDMGDDHVKIPAGWLIEQCGWKGRTLGPAAVHDRQALVLVNRGAAKGKDILALCQAIRHDVSERFAIDIHPEVNFIGNETNESHKPYRHYNLVILDGYSVTQSDLDWQQLTHLPNLHLTVYDRTRPEQTLERCKEADAVFTNKVVFSRETIAALPRLRYIGVLATGYNVVDTEAARENGIIVTNIPAYSTPSVAQLVFAHLLNVTNQVAHYAKENRHGRWTKSPDFLWMDTPLAELQGKTFAVRGMGNIGTQVAQIAMAFGMRVLAVSSQPASALPNGVEKAEWKTALREADVLSLHCPLTEGTREMINHETLRLMKPDAILINTGRGPLVNEQDVANALAANQLGAYCADVLTTEPSQPDNPLLTAPRCYLTPHIAWATREARKRLISMAVANLSTFIEGKSQNVVNL